MVGTITRTIGGAVALVAALAGCQRGSSESAQQEMARRARNEAFHRDYPKWSGGMVNDRSEPHVSAGTAEGLFERAAATTRSDPSTPGLLACRLDVHPTRKVGDAAATKPDFQLMLTVDGLRRRWCCSREPTFVATFANATLGPEMAIDFYVSDKDVHRDDFVGAHELTFDGELPLSVRTPDFDAECRWLPNDALGSLVTEARTRAGEAMHALADRGSDRHLARAALQQLAGLVGWSDPELEAWVHAYDRAAAESS